ncbi:MAG: hypothetical protein ACXVI0_11495 [Halobacteriota archaeon]
MVEGSNPSGSVFFSRGNETGCAGRVGNGWQHYFTRDIKTRYFTRDELDAYRDFRLTGLAARSRDWLIRAPEILWEHTQGVVSRGSLTAFRDYVVDTWPARESHRKLLQFTAAFLKHLSKTTFDPQFQAYTVFLERPKTVKVRKAITSRIVTIEDIRNVLAAIRTACKNGRLTRQQYDMYRAVVLFGAFSGQRPTTLKALTVGQLRVALETQKSVVHVLPSQDKVRMEHYVPLHPEVNNAVRPILKGRSDDEKAFWAEGFVTWLKRNPVPMSRCQTRFTSSDLRKFAEQHGDIIGWDQSNRSYILTHGVSGVDWAHYKHPLPEHVYDVYMQYWEDVILK